MNIRFKFFLVLTIVVSIVPCNVYASDLYHQELKTFKAMQKYKALFDKDANMSVQLIRRDIQNYTHLTWFQRFVRGAFLACDAVVVTPETMPKLYTYVEGICKQQSIDTPTIFLTRERGFFNAAAQKLLTSSGAIIIGQHLLKSVTDAELEAVVAHEIGHIRYNHVNKTMGLYWFNVLVSYELLHYITEGKDSLLNLFISLHLSSFITMFMINKKFEKQADRFAYEENGKGEGLIAFFEHIKQKNKDRDNDLSYTRTLLTTNKPTLGFYNYYLDLAPRYYCAKLGHLISKGYRWIYHNTPYGPHPSPNARIAAVKKYLEEQN